VHFQTDLAAMDGMLETLERKGRVQRLEARCSRCKGCAGGCPEEAVVFRVV
jgi:ferredoxin